MKTLVKLLCFLSVIVCLALSCLYFNEGEIAVGILCIMQAVINSYLTQQVIESLKEHG